MSKTQEKNIKLLVDGQTWKIAKILKFVQKQTAFEIYQNLEAKKAAKKGLLQPVQHFNVLDFAKKIKIAK